MGLKIIRKHNKEIVHAEKWAKLPIDPEDTFMQFTIEKDYDTGAYTVTTYMPEIKYDIFPLTALYWSLDQAMEQVEKIKGRYKVLMKEHNGVQH